jgi:hypothetical protein
LLGLYRIKGTEPRILLFFHAAEEVTSDSTFAIDAKVVKRKPFSLIPPDPISRSVSMPMALTTRHFRPGFIYSHMVVLRQRIGVERFYGGFMAKDGSAPPMRLDNERDTELLLAN